MWRRDRLAGEDLSRLIGDLEEEVQVRDSVVCRLVVLRCVRRFQFNPTKSRGLRQLPRFNCRRKETTVLDRETLHMCHESIHSVWLKFGPGGHV